MLNNSDDPASLTDAPAQVPALRAPAKKPKAKAGVVDAKPSKRGAKKPSGGRRGGDALREI
jgi:hypothetical protein